MIFPKSKMRLLETFEGKQSKAGWLELNLTAVDMEGVTRIQINLDDLEALQSQRSKEEDALEKAKKLLGG